jgi:hypothetical protein
MTERIKLDMNMADCCAELARGAGGYNPGAIRVCINLAQLTPMVDPDASMGGFAHLLSLDTLEIYGSDIWLLFKDICGEDTARMIAVLRGWQLGIATRDEIKGGIDYCKTYPSAVVKGDYLYPLTNERVEEIVAVVRAQLPNFDKSVANRG